MQDGHKSEEACLTAAVEAAAGEVLKAEGQLKVQAERKVRAAPSSVPAQKQNPLREAVRIVHRQAVYPCSGMLDPLLRCLPELSQVPLLHFLLQRYCCCCCCFRS